MPATYNATNWFDTFDDVFEQLHTHASGPEVAGAATELQVYRDLLQSDGQTGRFAAMKNDWLLRARVAVAAADKEYHDALAAIAAHEASGGDEKGCTSEHFKKRWLAHNDKELRDTRAIDADEGNVSDNHVLVSCPPRHHPLPQVELSVSRFHFNKIQNFFVNVVIPELVA